MNNAEYRFTLDLQKIQSQVTLQVNTGDTARSLVITLTNGGVTHTLRKGSMAVLSAKKSNGKTLFNSCTIGYDYTTIRYDFTSLTADAPGIMQCELLITEPEDNGFQKSIVAPRFTIIVDDLVNDGEVISADENTFLLEVQSQEAARVLVEDERVSNEATRKSKEDARESNEATRKSNEKTRNSNESTRKSNENQRTTDETQRIANESGRKNNENQRIANEETRQANEEKRIQAEGDRAKLAEGLKNTELRISTLEAASSGNIYRTIEETRSEGTIQLSDVLPYGILSRVGGSPMRWRGDSEVEYGSGYGGVFGISELPTNDGEFLVISDASEIHFFAYEDPMIDSGGHYTLTTHFVIPTNQKVKLSEATVYVEDSRDGSISNGVFESAVAEQISRYRCDSDFRIVHGNLQFVNHPLESISIGMPFDLSSGHNALKVSENSFRLVHGQMPYIPCKIPKGTTVTVYGEGGGVNGYYLSTGTTSSTIVTSKIAIGKSVTLTQDANYISFYRPDSTVVDVVKNFRVMFSSPGLATAYNYKTISFNNLKDFLDSKGYEYGAFLDDTCYNYLDLTTRTYHQYCKVENNVVVKLSKVVNVDVSAYLEENADVLPLYPSCIIKFKGDGMPYTISYKEKIGG